MEFLHFLLKHLKFDGAIRPCAKICEHLANAFYAKKDNRVKQMLKPEHVEAIVSTGFDWLITPQKIAVRAYTMNTLYLFGLDESWIHPELQHLIETKIIHESKGTKASLFLFHESIFPDLALAHLKIQELDKVKVRSGKNFLKQEMSLVKGKLAKGKVNII